MTIGIITLAYGDPELIKACIKCYKDYDVRHLFVVPTKSFSGDDALYEETLEAVKDEDHITVSVRGHTFEQAEAEIRNIGLTILDTDISLIIDTDEYFEPKEFLSFVNEVKTSPDPAFSLKPHVYWKDWEHELYDTFRRIVAVKRGGYHTYSSQVNVKATPLPHIFHHLSWCKPKDISKKIKNYSHSHKFNHFTPYEEDGYAHFPNSKIEIGKKRLPNFVRRLF